MLRKELCIVVALLPLFGCSQIYLYEPVSGGQVVKLQENYTDVAALQIENSRFRVRIAGFLSGAPKFALEIENKTNQDLSFDATQISGQLVEKDIALPVVHCYKPPANKFVTDTTDFEKPCENQIKAGQMQKRYIYLAKFPESFKQYGKPVRTHHIRLTAAPKSGLEMNCLFKLTEG
jgi:hypothetical protein